MRTLGSLCCVVLVAACAEMYGKPYSPRSGQAGSSRAAVYSKAVQAIEGLGMTAVTNDATAGVVTSSWSCDESDHNQCVARTRFYISIADDGSYTIENQCQQRSTMVVRGAPFNSECDHSDRRPQEVIDQQNYIATAMETATGKEAPAAETQPPPEVDKPKAASTMYCTETALKGVCGKDTATCEQRRAALTDATPCALVESVVCFKAMRVSDGKRIKVCAPNERLCGNSQALYTANVEEYENVEPCQ